MKQSVHYPCPPSNPWLNKIIIIRYPDFYLKFLKDILVLGSKKTGDIFQRESLTLSRPWNKITGSLHWILSRGQSIGKILIYLNTRYCFSMTSGHQFFRTS